MIGTLIVQKEDRMKGVLIDSLGRRLMMTLDGARFQTIGIFNSWKRNLPR
jgi:hypothetical protein